jgi:hypothetical protein
MGLLLQTTPAVIEEIHTGLDYTIDAAVIGCAMILVIAFWFLLRGQ